jgi:Lon protease-like protein
MPSFDDLGQLPADFSGKVRLFPLPNVVLFPHVMQPLHVVESRYRALVEDALADDQLVAMAILAPGWEKDYDGTPPVYPVACLGRIAGHCRLDDGSYNVLLLGLRRVRLLRELRGAHGFRRARVEVCSDQTTLAETFRAVLHAKLRQTFIQVLPMLPDAQEQLDQLLGTDVSLGVLTDVVSYMLDITIAEKQTLLAEVNIHRRAELLLGHLAATAAEQFAHRLEAGGFPPLFSEN